MPVLKVFVKIFCSKVKLCYTCVLINLKILDYEKVEVVFCRSTYYIRISCICW